MARRSPPRKVTYFALYGRNRPGLHVYYAPKGDLPDRISRLRIEGSVSLNDLSSGAAPAAAIRRSRPRFRSRPARDRMITRTHESEKLVGAGHSALRRPRWLE